MPMQRILENISKLKRHLFTHLTQPSYFWEFIVHIYLQVYKVMLKTICYKTTYNYRVLEIIVQFLSFIQFL